MTTPQTEIDELNGILHGENIELLRDDLVFAVARRIVKYHDPDLPKQFPGWVNQGILEMCEMYRRDREYGVVSNLGTVDHSQMVEQLVALLEASARPGSGL